LTEVSSFKWAQQSRHPLLFHISKIILINLCLSLKETGKITFLYLNI
jgi:hypothetical protein